MKYLVSAIVGENCMTPEDGQKLYEEIHPELVANRLVELDFAGVDIFASPFFSFAIGQLLADLPPETLNQLLSVQNLSPVGLQVLKRVIENAKEYYTNPKLRHAVDEVLAEQAVCL